MTDIGFEGKVIAELTALRLIIDTHQKLGINVNGARDNLVEAYAEDSINRLFDGLRTRVPPGE